MHRTSHIKGKNQPYKVPTVTKPKQCLGVHWDTSSYLPKLFRGIPFLAPASNTNFRPQEKGCFATMQQKQRQPIHHNQHNHNNVERQMETMTAEGKLMKRFPGPANLALPAHGNGSEIPGHGVSLELARCL